MELPVPMVFVKQGEVWQYRIVERSLAKEGPPSESELNALGSEGWELAGITSDPKTLRLYFKRFGRPRQTAGPGGPA